MYAFLSKKIGIPKINKVAWNSEQGVIAIGGDKGMLRIIRLEEKQTAQQPGGQAGQTFSVNLTLENHTGQVTTVVWNEKFRKLTSADDNGLIIVWMKHQQSWFEEMINNRNKSSVTDMKWSPDGQKICIVYLDGAVIVGSVEGSRLWGKDYKHNLTLIEWSPDSKLIVFGTQQGEVFIYDTSGSPINQLKMSCLDKLVEPSKLSSPNLPLAAISWYENAKMYSEQAPTSLCIAYLCGRVQLMVNDKDDDPTLLQVPLTISAVRWNPKGTILAIGGVSQESGEIKGVIQFYNNQGLMLRQLKTLGQEKINSITWEGSGTRICMSVDTNLYFANIKLEYKWGFINNQVLVFAYQKLDRVEFSVIFWNIANDKKHIKFLRNLIHIKAAGDMCCLITEIDEETWQIDLCNSIGSPIDTKMINVHPVMASMTKTHIIVCSEDNVYIWQYKNQVARLTTFEVQTNLRKLGREQAWFIDSQPDTNQIYDYETFDIAQEAEDVICAVCANSTSLFIGRESGAIQKFTLPHVTFETKLFLKSRPAMMNLNCDASRIAVVDNQGILSILSVNNQGGTILNFERKDCWFVIFSEDNPEAFACMEKSRIHVVNDVEAQEPVSTDGYICSFVDLSVKIVYLDELMKTPDGVIKSEEVFQDIETKLLKDTRDMLYKLSMQETFSFIQKYNYPFLWKVYAQKALEDYDFINAENAFLKLNDYGSIQFLKRIQMLDDKSKQKAEINAYYKKYDESEELYRKIERNDLAIQMHFRAGHYSTVLELIENQQGYDEIQQKAENALGYQFAEDFRWDQAVPHFQRAKNLEGLIECYMRIEDYTSLEELLAEIPDGSPILNDLGEKFQSVGLCDSAVKCFQKTENFKKAIDCCVLLNNWGLAVDLAEQHNYVQLESLLVQYANKLLEKKQILEAAELYRKSHHNTEAAKLLSQIANDLVEKDQNPLHIKKLYVMAALEVDLYKKRMLDATMTGQNVNTAKTLNSLITSTINTSSADKILNNPWRGAEAWHFFLLIQKHLYQGQFKLAVISSIRLSEYELELDAKKIYSLMAIASYYNRSLRQCSRAFVKLAGIKDLSKEEKASYENIAVSIFTRYHPKDPVEDKLKCPGKNCKESVTEQYDTHCPSCGANFSACVASGRSILEREFYQCKSCKHKMIESEVKKINLRNCALCHTAIDPKRFGTRDESELKI